MHHLACNYSTTSIFFWAVTGSCIPKIINSNPSSELRKSDLESECVAYCLCIERHRSSDSCDSWPVCLAFIKFCLHLLLTESLKILTVSDRTVSYEFL